VLLLLLEVDCACCCNSCCCCACSVARPLLAHQGINTTPACCHETRQTQPHVLLLLLPEVHW
jgi:hypothetical protein